MDEADKQFYKWKKCIHCATDEDPSRILPYDYRLETDSCGRLFNIRLSKDSIQLIHHTKVVQYASAIESWSTFYPSQYLGFRILTKEIASEVNRLKSMLSVVTGTLIGRSLDFHSEIF